jgi:hypothetical protein
MMSSCFPACWFFSIKPGFWVFCGYNDIQVRIRISLRIGSGIRPDYDQSFDFLIIFCRKTKSFFDFSVSAKPPKCRKNYIRGFFRFLSIEGRKGQRQVKDIYRHKGKRNILFAECADSSNAGEDGKNNGSFEIAMIRLRRSSRGL